MQPLASRTAPVVHSTVAAFRSFRKSLPSQLSVGFVPTMGALHKGHLSLVERAREENDMVIASIFVNPTQFAAGEDFDKYPRQLERDTDLLSDYGVDHIFAPQSRDIYSKNHVTYVEPEGFDDISEGRARPGHFRGVATVVTKLFNIVQPTNAYFGRKDAAQVCLIQKIVEDLNIDVNVVPMPTIREADGLAMSSRNEYLSEAERPKANVLFRSLQAAENLWRSAELPIPASTLIESVEEVLRTEPLVSDIQYVAVDDRSTMKSLDKVTEEGCVVSIACKLGNVRLIDNVFLEKR